MEALIVGFLLLNIGAMEGSVDCEKFCWIIYIFYEIVLRHGKTSGYNIAWQSFLLILLSRLKIYVIFWDQSQRFMNVNGELKCLTALHNIIDPGIVWTSKGMYSQKILFSHPRRGTTTLIHPWPPLAFWKRHLEALKQTPGQANPPNLAGWSRPANLDN
jgi:hypothetical protein